MTDILKMGTTANKRITRMVVAMAVIMRMERVMTPWSQMPLLAPANLKFQLGKRRVLFLGAEVFPSAYPVLAQRKSRN
ncbi:unnamed protein product [Linum tenue]|uniref:Uncharacterized protein n=1 Tax=Linum tenue TaxID=586396 RepID=A0AAV0LBT9_9ROSI|nr:unnamed protein product [Linum tenue]